jgi:adenine deaminase
VTLTRNPKRATRNPQPEARNPEPETRNPKPATRNSIAQRRRWIAIARGDEPADLVLSGGQVLSVFTDEVFRADVAIADGFVVGVGEYDGPNILDVSEKFLIPGFIDGHCHIESSKLSVHEFARAVLRSGTTTVVVDPHELANVLGVAGIEYVLDASRDIPLNVLVMIPSCVPASSFESPLQELRAADFAHLLSHPRVIGLAEMMNYPAVISGDGAALEKLESVSWRRIDGHAPSVTGRDLSAYLVGGPSTDHESVALEEALEKRRLGMWIMIREASMIRNLHDLLPLVKEHGTENTCFVTDDREAGTLLHEGHINAMVRLAVQEGLTVGDAVKLATLNVSRCHGLEQLGAIAPGYRADVCVLDDLESFVPGVVLKDGRIVVANGTVLPFDDREELPALVRNTVHMASLSPHDLSPPMVGDTIGAPTIRVIDIVPDQVVTRSTEVEATVHKGWIVADPARDLAKLAVVERHRASGRVGVGFVRGFGLQEGALASTVAHDAHNVIVLGVDDNDMIAAVDHLAKIGGGLVVVSKGNVIGELPLPIAGLMSDRPVEEVDAGLKTLERKLEPLGVSLATPFMYLGFLALSVIPELRLTDKGLVDVTRFALVPLVSGGGPQSAQWSAT